MPKLSNLLAESVTIKVPDLDMTITYRPGSVTPESHDATMELLDRKREPAAVAKSLAASLVSWDLTGDDDEPYPITEKALRKLPARFLFEVFGAIQGDLNPNAKKSKASGGSF